MDWADFALGVITTLITQYGFVWYWTKYRGAIIIDGTQPKIPKKIP